ncbi:hypothetical protein [uncultured Methylobacterium sp.]|uniref:hypothetical protein n=1 Tax=uncultured Methylobacterium sp. TaxID=157278 RepID=UPI0035C9C44C
MIDHSILTLQEAEAAAADLKARAYAIAPWLVNDAVASRRPRMVDGTDGAQR